MVQEQNGGEYRKTVSFNTLLERTVRQQPFVAFDLWPILEVRQACIEYLNKNVSVISSLDADWTESRIRMLAQEEDFEARKMWKGLLSWYIFQRPRHFQSSLKNRALEFAINLTKEQNNRWDYLSEAAKLVAKKIRDEPGLYWYVPSMREFMTALLSQVKSGIAVDSEWDYYGNRAVRIILHTGDVELLPNLKELLEIIERKEQLELLQAFRYEEKFSMVQRKAMLETAIRILTEERVRQFPDINVVLGSYLRKKAGLNGSVLAKLRYPQRVSVEKAREAVKIRLSLEPTRAEEKAKLLSALKYHTVELIGEGFVSPPKESEVSSYPNEPQIIDEAFKGLSCLISAYPTKGINRFSFQFVDHEEKKKRVTEDIFGYIFVE